MRPLFALFLLFAAIPAAWKDWRYSREIQVSAPGLTTFICPRDVYDHSGANFSDLRLIDNNGLEVPFGLQKRPSRNTLQWRSAKMIADNTKGGIVDMSFDVGEENKLHNTMQFDIPDQDFQATVDVFGSDDNKKDDKEWRLLRAGIPIYRMMPDGLEGNQTVIYPETYSRYIRVKITPVAPEGTSDAAASAQHATAVRLVHAQVSNDDSQKPEWLAYAPIFTPETSASTLQSWWKCDALSDALPVTGLRINVMNKDFHRAIRISVSTNLKEWAPLISNDIYRTSGEKAHERTYVELPETSARYWRVQFYDNGYPPLIVSKIELLGVPYHVVFHAKANTRYRMLYGNGRVVPADYEISRMLEHNAFQTATTAMLGDEEVNTVQRRGLMFWGLIAAGVLAVLIGIGFVVSLLSEGSESHRDEQGKV